MVIDPSLFVGHPLLPAREADRAQVHQARGGGSNRAQGCHVGGMEWLNFIRKELRQQLG